MERTHKKAQVQHVQRVAMNCDARHCAGSDLQVDSSHSASATGSLSVSLATVTYNVGRR